MRSNNQREKTGPKPLAKAKSGELFQVLRYNTEFPYLEKIKQARIACLAIIAEVFPSCMSSSSHTTMSFKCMPSFVLEKFTLPWTTADQTLGKRNQQYSSPNPGLSTSQFSSLLSYMTICCNKGWRYLWNPKRSLRESCRFNQNLGSAPQPCVQREG